ncbi:hypothetical protein T03_6600, partial [Trichinella britovi]
VCIIIFSFSPSALPNILFPVYSNNNNNDNGQPYSANYSIYAGEYIFIYYYYSKLIISNQFNGHSK